MSFLEQQLSSQVVAPPDRRSYSFAISATSGTPVSTYTFIATPLSPNQTGTRYFCSFADAVVRFSSATISTCTTAVSPLQ
jgi:hypothetical protein